MKPDNRTQLDLERRILHGLAWQWDHIMLEVECLNLPQPRKPLFRIASSANHWGHWSRRRREIVLSRDLILHHPWASITEVLRHEMAHQYAEEILGGDSTPHGPHFRKACKLLRANPASNGSFPTLREKWAQHDCSENDKIMLRTQKLLALAESSNLHEAEAAMRKAHELMLKYNINLEQDHRAPRMYSLCAGPAAMRHAAWEYELSHLVKAFYFVDAIWISTFIVPKNKTGTILELNGTEQNLKIAAYVYDFIATSLNREWRRYKKDQHVSGYRKNDFMIGVLNGFRQKLSHGSDTCTKKMGNQSTMALVPKQNQCLKDYMAYRHPRTRTSRLKPRYMDANVIEDGKKIGRTLVIAQGIENHTQHRNQLLD